MCMFETTIKLKGLLDPDVSNPNCFKLLWLASRKRPATSLFGRSLASRLRWRDSSQSAIRSNVLESSSRPGVTLSSWSSKS